MRFSRNIFYDYFSPFFPFIIDKCVFQILYKTVIKCHDAQNYYCKVELCDALEACLMIKFSCAYGGMDNKTIWIYLINQLIGCLACMDQLGFIAFVESENR